MVTHIQIFVRSGHPYGNAKFDHERYLDLELTFPETKRMQIPRAGLHVRITELVREDARDRVLILDIGDLASDAKRQRIIPFEK